MAAPSTRLGARVTIGALCLSLGLALAGVAPAWARTTKPAVWVAAARSTVISGDGVAVTGRTVPAGVTTVRLQAAVRGHWATVASVRTSRSGRFNLTARPTTSTTAFRVVRPYGGAATSATLRFGVAQCPTLALPRSPITSWFQQPGSARSPLTGDLAQLACAAAPGSTVRIAMYFIIAGSQDVEPVLTALQAVHRYRGVHVRFVMDDKGFTGGQNAATLKRLRSIGTLSLCRAGCRSESDSLGHLHTKTLTISNTVWRAGQDPVALTTSANLSVSQMHQFWQGARLMTEDPALVHELDLRFDSLAACATDCAAWHSPDQAHQMVQTWSTSAHDQVWTEPALGVRATSAGRGTAVYFSPVPVAGNPLEADLAALGCTAEHRIVRLTVFRGSTGRMKRVASRLEALQAAGCDVAAVVHRPESAAIAATTVAPLAAAHVTYACVANVHQKVLLADAVVAGRATREVIGGSQNFTTVGVDANDEVTVRTSSADATGRYADAIEDSYRQHLANWGAMWHQQVPCS